MEDLQGDILADHYEFHLLGSTKALLNLKKHYAVDEHLLLVGDVRFDYDSLLYVQSNEHVLEIDENEPAMALRSFNLDMGPLPQTKVEIDAIQKVANKSKLKTTMLSQLEASEQAFKLYSQKDEPSVIHLATHGFFYSADMANKGEGLPYYMVVNNALMRSGLGLAGANDSKDLSANYNADDGILTAYEISNMNLQHVDLAVLSACETGIGEISDSEGVYGLQRAFKLAGVDKLIMSLWKIEDLATKEFMLAFYDKLDNR